MDQSPKKTEPSWPLGPWWHDPANYDEAWSTSVKKASPDAQEQTDTARDEKYHARQFKMPDTFKEWGQKSATRQYWAMKDNPNPWKRKSMRNIEEIDQQASTQTMRKTKLCAYYAKGSCQRGDGCTYAHGQDDLEAYNLTVPSYEEKRSLGIPLTTFDMDLLRGDKWICEGNPFMREAIHIHSSNTGPCCQFCTMPYFMYKARKQIVEASVNDEAESMFTTYKRFQCHNRIIRHPQTKLMTCERGYNCLDAHGQDETDAVVNLAKHVDAQGFWAEPTPPPQQTWADRAAQQEKEEQPPGHFFSLLTPTPVKVDPVDPMNVDETSNNPNNAPDTAEDVAMDLPTDDKRFRQETPMKKMMTTSMTTSSSRTQRRQLTTKLKRLRQQRHIKKSSSSVSMSFTV
jgi:hypothetical protein